MNLYIEIENGKPKNHPAFEDNLIQAFGVIPDNWVSFVRVEKPVIGVYEVYEGVTYELINSVYTDVHYVRQMTEEEKLIKQDEVKIEWNNHFPSWIFNETLCFFESPVPYPQDDKRYYWDEPTINWVEVKNA
jgi:hypothetical protein